MSDRVERNFKMAHAASENRTRPASKEYLANYDAIFRKKKKVPVKKAVGKPKKISTKELGKLGFAMYGIR
jgi:hypothetical protein